MPMLSERIVALRLAPSPWSDLASSSAILVSFTASSRCGSAAPYHPRHVLASFNLAPCLSQASYPSSAKSKI
ncbi:hypothetical protein BCR35DRAFT_303245 [Leucosporidium creatinivorum]|uniref:Uncharacterized protein n=1 Tax=Leucosporidium creatinivorum TaxID=106004 RepID=A0A1Y2FJP6_9BASI|nr:hypothetical protein BCR35DRAFT_303245 [Leucosporidium creatinivorum]